MRKLNNRYRRGIAMEMAITMMLIMVALSIILITIWTLQFEHQQSDLKAFEEKILEYKVTDMAQKNGDQNEEVVINGKTYTVTESGTKYEIKDGDVIVLTIEISNDGTITSWQ